MSYSKFERMTEECGWIKHIPTGKDLKDVLRECIRDGRRLEIADSTTDRDLKILQQRVMT